MSTFGYFQDFPLKALMADQVSQLNRRNVKAIALMDTTKYADIDEDVSIIFASPESATLPKWKRLFMIMKRHISLLAFDEAHCISSWGLDFRPHYRQIAVLQSYCDVPNLVLTATATQKIQNDIYQVLGLSKSNTAVVAELPNRPNIFMSMKKSTENFELELKWMLDHMTETTNRKKLILYVRSINLCYRIYLWLTTELMDINEQLVKTVQMYHANTDSETKDKIMTEFISNDTTDTSIQLLISTVAFGMGVNINDIDVVVHWGLPSTALDYWQEIGRCARDGRNGHAICYCYKRSVTKCEDKEFKAITELDKCLRVCVLDQFLLEGMERSALERLTQMTQCLGLCEDNCTCQRCQCCVFCQMSCTCKKKTDDPLQAFLSKK